MSVVEIAEARSTRERRWMSIDFVMRAISVAMHLADRAGLPRVSALLSQAHQSAREERDRA